MNIDDNQVALSISLLIMGSGITLFITIIVYIICKCVLSEDDISSLRKSFQRRQNLYSQYYSQRNLTQTQLISNENDYNKQSIHQYQMNTPENPLRRRNSSQNTDLPSLETLNSMSQMNMNRNTTNQFGRYNQSEQSIQSTSI